MQTDATLSEDDTDWEDDGIRGLPKDPVIFEYFSNVLQSKDLKVNDSLISPILDPFKRAIVERIMKDFWKIFNQQWSEAIRKCTGTLCTANSSLSGQLPRLVNQLRIRTSEHEKTMMINSPRKRIEIPTNGEILLLLPREPQTKRKNSLVHIENITHRGIAITH